MAIKNCGLIVLSYFAGLVLFNPKTVVDNASIETPTALSTGIEYVWVNVKLVYQNQKVVENYPRVLVRR